MGKRNRNKAGKPNENNTEPILFTLIKNEPAVHETSEAVNDGSVVFISTSKTNVDLNQQAPIPHANHLNTVDAEEAAAAAVESDPANLVSVLPAVQKFIKLEDSFHMKLLYFAKKIKKLEAEVKRLRSENEASRTKIIELEKEKNEKAAQLSAVIENLSNSLGNFRQAIEIFSNESSQQDTGIESVSVSKLNLRKKKKQIF